MNASYIDRNRVQRERLEALAARLSDRDLARPLGEDGWTVSAAFAHLAYWDERALRQLQDSLHQNFRRVWEGRPDPDAVNADLLASWLARSPREALEDALRAMAAADGFIESLSAAAAEVFSSGPPWLLDRSLHRGEHLDQIERALAS